MTAEMDKLAARVEALAGPDRDIDALIAPLQGLRIVDEGHPLGRCCYDQNGVLVVLPPYTRSLDAALTLVPEGWRKSLCDDPDDTGWVIAELWTRSGHAYANAATPSLALCAAALRAHSTAAGDGG